MKFLNKKIIGLVAMLFVLLQTVAFAATIQVTGVRTSTSAEKVRIVFDVDSIPEYKVSTQNGGQQILLDFSSAVDRTKLTKLIVKDDFVTGVSFSSIGGVFRTTIDLKQSAQYQVKQLKNPSRIFMDISKEYEKMTSQEMAPGLVQTTYVRQDGRGMLTGYFVDVDTSRYSLRPALANGVIAGRGTVSAMSDANQAVAAVNASYFALDGEILGLTKIDGQVVSTTYLPRSAFGVMADGTPIIGTVDYNGQVKTKGVSLPINGVNCERGENTVVLYNEYYDTTTGTNEYGVEYVVKDNKVIAINTANSKLDAGCLVVSAHGTAKDALAGIKVGDKMEIVQNIGTPWDKAPQVLGVGPRLVMNGAVDVTAAEEQFGGDVANGRAPRTAIGILPNQHVLLAVVDGRQSTSIGCTLAEMGELLKKFGAVNAVNFDGGGSSELVIGGRIINKPSDGSERSVGSALVVCTKAKS